MKSNTLADGSTPEVLVDIEHSNYIKRAAKKIINQSDMLIEGQTSTDGAFMTSTSIQNPSITYIVLAAIAVDYATQQMSTGEL